MEITQNNYLDEKAALKKIESEREKASRVDICLNDLLLPLSKSFDKKSMIVSPVKDIDVFKQPQSRGKI